MVERRLSAALIAREEGTLEAIQEVAQRLIQRGFDIESTPIGHVPRTNEIEQARMRDVIDPLPPQAPSALPPTHNP